MKSMEAIVVESYRKFLASKGIENAEVDLEIKISRENYLDSLGFVALVIQMESLLEYSLDEYLPKLSRAANLREIVTILDSDKNKEKYI